MDLPDILIREVVPSPNWDSRTDGVVIDTVVLHATVINSLEGVIQHFADPKQKVSAHYTIDRDGSIVRHVPELFRAWHAGSSQMQDGRSGVNDFSIGIELVNLNTGGDPYPEAQLVGVIALIKDIRKRYPIRFIVAHSEIATPPGRKSDPLGLNLEYVKRAVGI